MALRELRIRNLVVIPEAMLAPGDTFTVLTGETGSGKSVCVTALRLALGTRADADLIRPGADSATVSAVFDATSLDDASRAALHEVGVALDDDLLTLTRDIAASGRSSCRINGALVSQALMRSVGEHLVDVTAQGASHRITQAVWQRNLLDSSGNSALQAGRERVATLFEEWRTATSAVGDARRLAASSQAEIERAHDIVNELGALDLREDEEVELVGERFQLRHTRTIVEATSALNNALVASETGALVDVLNQSRFQLEPLAQSVAEIEQLQRNLDDLIERARDVAADSRHLAEATKDDPSRLASVEERLDALARIKRRYGSIDNARETLAQAVALLEAQDGSDSVAVLDAALATCAGELAGAAVELSRLRAAAARQLERAVVHELGQLELPKSRFTVMLGRTADTDGLEIDGQSVRCAAHGIDDVEFRLATNPEAAPVPLDSGPSGGELSRLTLALRAVAATADCPTVVLDEVDTGLGGETAARVGDVLARLGRNRQVLAVTHRPEIAARADAHLLITKIRTAKASSTSVTECNGDDRTDEIARLMSGRLTAAARARAAELLREGTPNSKQRKEA